MRGLGLRGGVRTALAALVILLACAGGASAATTSVWPAASALALPSGASAASSLPSISCGSSSQCVAVGAYTAAGGTAPMAFTATNGVWSAGSAIALPPGASSGELTSVSCPAAGTCIAVGEEDSGTHPIEAGQAGGTWTGATALPASGSLSGISCPAAGSCSAVGSRGGQPIGVSVVSGSFGQPANVPLPSGGQSGALNGVACTTPGNCVAAGSYDAGGQTLAMLATETAGVWGQATPVTLPAGAAPTQDATLNSISCPTSGHCIAVGSYLNAAQQTAAMIDTETGAEAVALTPPAGATASVLDSISCTSSTSCTATGSVLAGGVAPLAATDSGGSWSPGTALSAPAGAASSGSISLAVACTDAERCDAAGVYPTASGTAAMAVDSHPSLVITRHALPAGAVGSRYSARIATSGGTGGNLWTLTGSLPAGLSLNPSNGVVSGTPTTDQTATFSVSVRDSASPPDQASQTLSISIGPATRPTKPTTQKGSSGTARQGRHAHRHRRRQQRGAKVGSVKILHGSTVRFTVRCRLQRHCTGRVAVLVVEHLRGRKVIAINATTHRARGTRTRTIWLGSVRYALRGGHRVTRTIHLNRFGSRLLRARHTLRAGLALRPARFKRATIEHTLKLHRPPAKRKHSHRGA